MPYAESRQNLMKRTIRWLPARPLPAHAYVPGVSPARPELVVPEAIDHPFDEWLLDEAYLFGADLYEAHFAWEAHEAWEAAWKLASDPVRRELLQGLIQCAAAVVKSRVKAAGGVRSLADRGTRRVERAAELAGAPHVMGLDAGRFTRAIRSWAAASEPAPEARPPLALEARSRDRLGALTDVRVRTAGTEIEPRAEGLVVRTPTRPDFHDGHLLLLDEAPTAESLDAQLAACREAVGEHPGRPLSLCWEVGDVAAAPGLPAAEALAVLRSKGVTESRAPPEGVRLRPVTEDESEALVGLALDVLGGPEDFWRWRMSALCDRLARAGRIWGAFRGERLIGSLGLYESPTLLRFQEVMTRADERGRGVATSLVARALADARARHPHALAVIVAEPSSQAERIYQRLEFRRVSTQYWLRRHTENGL
jgi:GNAT superfamily N-acetyltransferase